MISRLTLALSAGVAASAMAAVSLIDPPAMALLAKFRPDVRWDSSTIVAADFDADGKDDFAVVGYVSGGLILAIQSSYDVKPTNFQYLSFGIGGAQQDAICVAPAKLSAVPLLCDSEGNALPGCRASRGTSGLTLSDHNDDCDPINLYWDHDHHRMAWWRN